MCSMIQTRNCLYLHLKASQRPQRGQMRLVTYPTQPEIMFPVFAHTVNKHHKILDMGKHRMLEMALFGSIMTW